MSTVTINLKDVFGVAVSCEVIFRPVNTPFAGSDRAFYINKNRSVRTAADGTGSATLAAGTYKVMLTGEVIGASGNEVTIGVPDDDQTYPLTALITDGVTPPVPPVYQGPPGSQILTGNRDPLPGDGANTDYWFNTETSVLFGPKAGGIWPSSGTSLHGTDGREVELQSSATHIQWRYAGDALWTNLVALSDLEGPPGKEIELQKSATHIQWRYVGDPSWINLVALADLKGGKGDDGREIELQASSTHIQWRYTGDSTWINLVSLADLKGPRGDTGPGVPTGGAAGQVLVKTGAADFETAWQDFVGKSLNDGGATFGYDSDIDAWTTSRGLDVNTSSLINLTADSISLSAPDDVVALTGHNVELTPGPFGSVLVGGATAISGGLQLAAIRGGLLKTDIFGEVSKAVVGTDYTIPTGAYPNMNVGFATNSDLSKSLQNGTATFAYSSNRWRSNQGIVASGGLPGRVGFVTSDNVGAASDSTQTVITPNSVQYTNPLGQTFAYSFPDASGTFLMHNGSGAGLTGYASSLSVANAEDANYSMYAGGALWATALSTNALDEGGLPGSMSHGRLVWDYSTFTWRSIAEKGMVDANFLGKNYTASGQFNGSGAGLTGHAPNLSVGEADTAYAAKGLQDGVASFNFDGGEWTSYHGIGLYDVVDSDTFTTLTSSKLMASEYTEGRNTEVNPWGVYFSEMFGANSLSIEVWGIYVDGTNFLGFPRNKEGTLEIAPVSKTSTTVQFTQDSIHRLTATATLTLSTTNAVDGSMTRIKLTPVAAATLSFSGAPITWQDNATPPAVAVGATLFVYLLYDGGKIYGWYQDGFSA